MRTAACLLLLALTSLGADPVDILPEPSLKGWTRIPIPPVAPLEGRQQWRVDVQNHTLICSGDGGHEWLRYDKELGDFDLHVEFRFTPRTPDAKYNSGIGIRMSKWAELWYQAQTGPAGGYLFGDTIVNGIVQRVNLSKEMKENRIKPAGEWNVYDIHAVGDSISLSVNGMVVNEIKGAPLRKGYIGLEAEGFEITFRNLTVKTLD